MACQSTDSVRVGQLWEMHDTRRPGNHRILWVSDCGQYCRLMRVGGKPGNRGLRTAYLLRRYHLTADAPAPAVYTPEEIAA